MHISFMLGSVRMELDCAAILYSGIGWSPSCRGFQSRANRASESLQGGEQDLQGGRQLKIIVVGGTGTIGREVVKLLSSSHEIVTVGYDDGDLQVDIASKDAIKGLFREVGSFDAVISATGVAKFGSIEELSDEDYMFGLTNKLMGQVNLVRVGLNYINDNGSFTLTTGVSQKPRPGSSAVTMANAAVEGFVRAAALELPRSIRANAVSPGPVKETLGAKGKDSSHGIAAATLALSYKESVEGNRNGEVLDAR